MLDVLHDILSQLNEKVKAEEDKVVYHCTKVFDNFEPCIEMLNTHLFDLHLVEKSS